MNKILNYIYDGTINVEDLVSLPELIGTAKFAKEGVEACKKTLYFRMGEEEIIVFTHYDNSEMIEAWGKLKYSGLLECYSTSSHYPIMEVNLLDVKEVFLALTENKFAIHLRRFLEEKIKKASEM